jgi:hypothetical protein
MGVGCVGDGRGVCMCVSGKWGPGGRGGRGGGSLICYVGIARLIL